MRTFDSDSHTAGGGGGSQRAVPLPGVGDTAAGAELAAMLESVPVQRVSGHDTVEYVKAAYRLVAHYQALFLQALLETGLRMPAPDDQVVRTQVPGDFAAEEARAALVWSRSRAESTFGRAYELFGQTPVIGSAMLDGTLDETRANAFCDWTRGLADEHQAAVIDELLPIAPKLTVRELIDRIKRMAIALDPEWAERRYRESAAGRRVELRQTPAGTADLAGRDLPADRAKTGSDRIHSLAQACKRVGDKRRIDTIRADVFLGMLDGLFQHMTDQQIVDYVLNHPIADDDAAPDDGTPPDEDNPNGDSDPPNDGTDGPSGANPHGGSDPSSGDAQPNGNARPNHGTQPDHGGTRPTGGGASPASGGASPAGGSGGDCGEAEPATAGRPAEERSRSTTPQWNVHELRAELTALLGNNDHPAELPGLGYIPAGVARKLIVRMASAEWRFVICTPNGVPICSGITVTRPASQRNVLRDPHRGGILEIQLTTTDLDDLTSAVADGRHADWAEVIGDIADRYRTGMLDTANPDSDPRRRRAQAGLRRWVEVRDRYCLHPTCRMPASQTDQDHRTDYAAGGLTIEQNLDSECRHDHNLQHDGGWRVHRPQGSDPLTGPIIWTSPLRHRYESRPPPVMQRYPEPGRHYPGHDTLPDWFTAIIKQARAAQHARAQAGARGTGSIDEQPPRPTSQSPAEPPF